MKTRSAGDWLQIVASIGVLAGLLLVRCKISILRMSAVLKESSASNTNPIELVSTGDNEISSFIDGVSLHHAPEIASTIAGRAWLEASTDALPVAMPPHVVTEIKNPT